MISWACVIMGAILLWAGSLMLAYARGLKRDDYASPDPMGCRDCGTRDQLNMWHRCVWCTALLRCRSPRSPEVVDLVYRVGVRS